MALPVAGCVVAGMISGRWEWYVVGLMAVCVIYPPLVALGWMSILADPWVVKMCVRQRADFKDYPRGMSIIFVDDEDKEIGREEMATCEGGWQRWHGYLAIGCQEIKRGEGGEEEGKWHICLVPLAEEEGMVLKEEP